MTERKHLHFIGIGGIGMSALAEIAIGKGWTVSGSDLKKGAVAERLRGLGADVLYGQAAATIERKAGEAEGAKQLTVVYSTAVKEDNPEFAAAQQLGCLLIHRSDLLEYYSKTAPTLAVAGTHGKTTTSSLLAVTMAAAGLRPSFAIGGIVKDLGTNGRWDSDALFVVEADESDGTFTKYHPQGAIVTNVDADHLDHYGDEETLWRAFEQFLGQVTDPKKLFCCGDDARLAALTRSVGGVTYGFSEGCDVVIEGYVPDGWGARMALRFGDVVWNDVALSRGGHHNALNGAAVAALALASGVHEDAIREALATFQGPGRRCDRIGEVNGIIVVDDYAHHPTEIAVTLEAAACAKAQGGRLIAVFQPHRYTRTRDCIGSFSGSFDAADIAIVTDLFAAGESPIAGVSHESVLAEVPQGEYLPREGLTASLAARCRPGDIVITMGAGDVTCVAPELVHALKQSALV